MIKTVSPKGQLMWEDNVRRVVPYTPGEQPKIDGLIKLNTNENPYPPSPRVQEYLKTYKADDFRKYPDPTVSKLVNAIARVYGRSPKETFVGVGSDDVLATAFLTFFYSDKPVLFPDITYSFYDVWAEVYRIPYRQIPLTDNFRVRKEDYFVPNGGIVLANPNAPTGVELDFADVREIIEKNRDSVVIVDEAYMDFGSRSVLDLIDEYDNLLVVGTFSKSRAMAGMRIGYAFGCEKMIKYLLDVKYSINSYTMNMPSIELGTLAVEDTEYFELIKEKVIKTREWTKKELRDLGFSFEDSHTNFIFAKYDGPVSRDDIAAELRKRNILVRCFNGERIKDYMRISIGTDEEMRIVIDALKEIIC